MSNVALNKAATSNNYVNPYKPANGNNGVLTPLSRWVGSSPLPPSGTPAPNWLNVDLAEFYWINRWVVKQMGNVGWSPNFNMCDYKLQGSLDNINWFDLDSVVNNSSNSTDRAIAPRKVRWIRVYITKGLRCNTNFSSIVELEVYNTPPTDSTLASLSLSSGSVAVPLNPQFVKTTNTYTASVGFDITSINATAAATDPNAIITVNGIHVLNGQPSQPVNLAPGAVTPVSIVVTPVIGDPNVYTVNVTRASDPYLSGLVIKSGRSTLTLTPTFDRGTLIYTATASATASVFVTATAEEASATIKINGNPAVSGVALSVPVSTGSNQVDIAVTSGFGTDQKTYLCTITVGA